MLRLREDENLSLVGNWWYINQVSASNSKSTWMPRPTSRATYTWSFHPWIQCLHYTNKALCLCPKVAFEMARIYSHAFPPHMENAWKRSLLNTERALRHYMNSNVHGGTLVLNFHFCSLPEQHFNNNCVSVRLVESKHFRQSGEREQAFVWTGSISCFSLLNVIRSLLSTFLQNTIHFLCLSCSSWQLFMQSGESWKALN